MAAEKKKKEVKEKKTPAKKAVKKAAPKKTKSKKDERHSKIVEMTKEVMALIKDEIKEKANRDIISQDEENKFINAITKKFKRAKEEAQILLQIAKMTLEISALKKGLPDKYKKLGEKVFQMAGEKKISAADLKSETNVIKNIRSKIADTEKKIQDLKKAAKAMIE